MTFYACVKGTVRFLAHKSVTFKRLVVLLIIISVWQAQAASLSQTITLELNNVPLPRVMEQIKEQSGLQYLLTGKGLGNVTISTSIRGATLEDALNKISNAHGIEWMIKDQVIVLKTASLSPSTVGEPSVRHARQQVISGRVTDEQNQPLSGVSVRLKGENAATTTDNSGQYRLSVPSGATRTLEFSMMGYTPVTRTIDGPTSTIDVSLSPTVSDLEEVVVIGYGVQSRRDLTGAVTTVTAEEFNQGPIVSPQQLIQGKIAGVNIGVTSGEPGAGQTITVRGPGSIRSGNSPLFVIDGVPLDNGATGPSTPDVGFGSSSPLNPMNFINPNDILTIDVLKDASATAIYGSRGANGVIIITTKRGSAATAGLNYTNYFGVSDVGNRLDLLSADEYIAFAEANGTDENIYDRTIKTDWQDLLFRRAKVQNHQLSLNGAQQHSNYYVSLSAMQQEGLIQPNNLKRYTGRFNFEQRLLNDRLKFTVNLTASHLDNSGTPRGDVAEASAGNLISHMINANPTYPSHNPDGTIFNFPNGKNPFAMLDVYTDFTKTNRVLGNIEGALEIIRGLTYKINFAVDNNVANRSTQADRNNLPFMTNPEGRVVFSGVESTNRLIDNYLTYENQFNDHRFTILAGHSYQRMFNRFNSSSINNFSTDEIDAIYNPGIGTSLNISQNLPTGGASINELQSFFGRLNYSFKSKYLLTATMRADGSSKFGANNRYGYFPSISAAWRLDEEAFFARIEALEELKLRVGWGQTGNQEIPGKITLPLLTSSAGNGVGYPLTPTGITSGFIYSRTANPDIKWEVITQSNIGLDFAFFGGDVYGTVDYFHKTTNDILLNLTVTDPIAPTNSQWSNADMDIINKGVELALNYQKKSHTGWDWAVGANTTFLDNVVENAPFSILASGRLLGPGMSGITANGYINGQRIGTFYLLDFIGLDENGENVFRDVNGDGEINDADRITAGSAVPSFMYNFYGRVAYKNVSLSVNFNGVTGNKIYNNTANSYLNYPSLTKGLNVTRDVLAIQGESAANSATYSTRYLEDGSFLRLNNATLAYDFKTAKLPWLRNLGIYVTGQNLFLITNYKGFDPEVDIPANVDGRVSYGIDFTNYPRARTFMAGVNLSF